MTKGIKKGRKPVPPNETREERFQRIASPRAKKIKKYLIALTNMPKQPNYQVTQENAEKILTYLSDAINGFNQRYTNILEGKTESSTKKVEDEKVF